MMTQCFIYAEGMNKDGVVLLDRYNRQTTLEDY